MRVYWPLMNPIRNLLLFFSSFVFVSSAAQAKTDGWRLLGL